MDKFHVYRVGEEEPVRIVDKTARGAAPSRVPAAPVDSAAPASSGWRRWLLWVAVALAAAVVVALIVFLGRDAYDNGIAALDLARLTGKVPGWAVVAAPAAVALVLALATAYLAFGRHLSVKIVGVAAVVVVLAAPGLALGWANGTVGTLGSGDAGTTATVAKAKKVMDRPIPDKAMNILLIGADTSDDTADSGRSDTQILVRLDPKTKSISMLSLPRDLRVYVEGYGYTKMNAAYTVGGPELTIKTFKKLTGLPIHHFIEINFSGFWHVVNQLGGVYLPVDHRYFVPASASYKSINLKPGYQLVRGKQALNYVRFRHDNLYDFGRMQRQQLFLKELQRQSGRWSHDWGKVVQLIKAITREVDSDIDSLKVLKPLVELIFEVDTSKVNTVHLEAATETIDGVSYVIASDTDIAAAVEDFTNPVKPSLSVKGLKVTKKMYPVRVYNGSGVAGLATETVKQLDALGYRAEVGPDATEFTDSVSVVYAPKSLKTEAQLIGSLVWPSDVRIVDRVPGGDDAIKVFLASSFDGQIDQSDQETDNEEDVTLEKNTRYDTESWKALDDESPMHLEMPTSWSSSFTYDEFRSYTIKDTDGKRYPAAVAVVETTDGDYWDIQAMRWTDPPAIKDPTTTETIDGRNYMLFYQGDNLHMIAWRENGVLFWVLNSLDNKLSNDVMLGLATSFKPVK